jgi:hypothetical protein
MPDPAPTTDADLPDWARAVEARVRSGKLLPTDRYALEPERLMIDAGLVPDVWQLQLLRTPVLRTLLCCSRQSGKSTLAAALAWQVVLRQPGALVLLVSPTLRQSTELFRDKLLRLWNDLKRPLEADPPTQGSITLSNGSRIISLPGSEENVRGYSAVALLVIDEAARVPDPLYYSIRPMLAVSRGRLVALSTPYGRRGWFHQAWANGGGDWHRVLVRASDCPRIDADFLRDEERSLGQRWYRQEYECSFEAMVDAVFDYDAVLRIADDTVAPLWPETDDELTPYAMDDDDDEPLLLDDGPWPANVCRHCRRKCSPAALDAWQLCAECRHLPPREVTGDLPMGGERWVCGQCGRRYEKRPGEFSAPNCPNCSR